MTIRDLKEKFRRLNEVSECTVYDCTINEKADYLEISYKGVDNGCFWVIGYSGSLSEYLRQETELEKFRATPDAPLGAGQMRRANRPSRRKIAGK